MIWSTRFKKEDICKYTWVIREDGKRALLNCILIDWHAKVGLLDVTVLRGTAGGISHHYLVFAKVNICRSFWK